jgi:hypothetical protein
MRDNINRFDAARQPDRFYGRVAVRNLSSAFHLSLQHDQLLPERGILCLKPAFRLEWCRQHREHEPDQCDHVASLANSCRPSTPDEVFNTHRVRFGAQAF